MSQTSRAMYKPLYALEPNVVIFSWVQYQDRNLTFGSAEMEFIFILGVYAHNFW